MLLPDLLNQNKLFFTFADLEKGKSKISGDLESEILTKGTSILLHLIRIEQTNKACIEEFELFQNQLNIKDKKIVFSSTSLGFLINEISPLLSNLRLLQNLLIKFVKIYEKTNLPKSINDYIKKQDNFQINDKVKSILKKYWENSGKNLRDYRDVDQHYMSISEKYFMQIEPKSIFLLFPDNPGEKSEKTFTYEKNINGIDFLNKAFIELHNTFEEISLVYGSKPKKHQISVNLDQLGDLRPAKERTLAFLYKSEIKKINKKNTLNISGIGFDQMKDLKLSVREYYLDEERLKKINKKFTPK